MNINQSKLSSLYLRRVVNVDIPDVNLAKGVAQSQDSFSGIQGESHVPNVAPFVVESVNFRSFRVTRRRDLLKASTEINCILY